MKTTTVNISFQKRLLTDIDKVAKSESRSRSELLREAVRMYIDRKKQWDKVFAYSQRQASLMKVREADIAGEVAAHRKEKRRRK